MRTARGSPSDRQSPLRWYDRANVRSGGSCFAIATARGRSKEEKTFIMRDRATTTALRHVGLIFSAGGAGEGRWRAKGDQAGDKRGGWRSGWMAERRRRSTQAAPDQLVEALSGGRPDKPAQPRPSPPTRLPSMTRTPSDSCQRPPPKTAGDDGHARHARTR